MANIHVSRTGNANINVGGQTNSNINTGNTTMPKYVGARAEVTRTADGVRIWLKDYNGETEEIVAEAISDIITNEDGSLTFTLADGREITTDSLTGPEGDPGTDGFSPIATVSKSGNTATITITDKNGTTTANVYDGADGAGSVQDVEVDGVSVVTDGVAEIRIPSETDPTVPSWAKQQNKPSYMFSEIYGTPTTLSEYGITDAYTKSEVDVLVSAVLHFKGTKATVSLLPSSGNKTGDVWHITSDGSEWAWDGSQWQELGTSVDLSGYVPTSRKINGNALISDITLNIPSKTSDLLNDSGFITSASLPTEVYWATYGSTTYSDLHTAYMANKLIVLESYRIALSKYDGSVFTFVGFDSQTRIIQATLDSAGTWNMTWYNTPSKTSDLTNDSGFIAAETDPTVPAWAKASTKPTYTAIEVGALPSTTSIPSKTSDLTNDSGFITSSDVPQEIYWATYGTTTSAQIEAAYQAGKIVCVKYNSLIYTLNYRASAVTHIFGSDTAETHYSLNCDNNVWSASTTYYPPLDANDKIIDFYLPDYHDIFWATYGTTTTAEIVQALIANKIIFAEYGSRIYSLSKVNSSYSHDFTCFDSGVEYRISCNGNVWTASQVRFVPLDSNNKISASYLPVYDGGVTP